MIAVGHKYGLLALGANAQLDGHLLEIGTALVATHELPIEIPHNWKQWLGSEEVRRIKECKLFVLTSAPSETPKVFDDESIWLEHRLELFLRAAALTSVGFRIRYGQLLVGTRTVALGGTPRTAGRANRAVTAACVRDDADRVHTRQGRRVHLHLRDEHAAWQARGRASLSVDTR